jgi:hypothetical protein
LSDDDYVMRLVGQARSTPGATLEDAVIALKDRLLGEPWIDTGEVAPLEDLLGAQLTTAVDGVDDATLEEQLRGACGAYVVSPQYLLGGAAPADSDNIPKLTLTDHSYAASCARIQDNFQRTGSAIQVACTGDSFEVVLP